MGQGHGERTLPRLYLRAHLSEGRRPRLLPCWYQRRGHWVSRAVASGPKCSSSLGWEPVKGTHACCHHTPDPHALTPGRGVLGIYISHAPWEILMAPEVRDIPRTGPSEVIWGECQARGSQRGSPEVGWELKHLDAWPPPRPANQHHRRWAQELAFLKISPGDCETLRMRVRGCEHSTLLSPPPTPNGVVYAQSCLEGLLSRGRPSCLHQAHRLGAPGFFPFVERKWRAQKPRGWSGGARESRPGSEHHFLPGVTFCY